ncbi:hypothetical protein Tco_0564337, partial [Tanacetum coccineum]
DVRLNKPVNVDEGLIQKEGTDAKMINVQQGNENLETTLNQVIEDAHVTISTIAKKTELEYDFEEYYKALSKKLDWDNLEGDDYPFDLTKPLPLVMNGNRQMVPVDYFFNNDLKYLQGGISTMTYTTSTTKTKAAQYDLQGIEDIVPNIWMSRVEVMRKHGYGYLREIENRLTNLSGDDVSDFAIWYRIFTKGQK